MVSWVLGCQDDHCKDAAEWSWILPVLIRAPISGIYTVNRGCFPVVHGGTYSDYGTLFIVSNSLVDALLLAGALGSLVKGLCRHFPHPQASENSLAIPWAPGRGREGEGPSVCISEYFVSVHWFTFSLKEALGLLVWQRLWGSCRAYHPFPRIRVLFLCRAMGSKKKEIALQVSL